MQNVNEEIEKAVQHKINQCIAAAKKYQEEPERAEEYIRRTINLIWTTGKQVGEEVMKEELFKPNMN
jgi:hypothetical protein